MKQKKRFELKIKINLSRLLLGLMLVLLFLPFLVSLGQNSLSASKIDLSTALSDIKAEKVDNLF
jgi:hypothetical protein